MTRRNRGLLHCILASSAALAGCDGQAQPAPPTQETPALASLRSELRSETAESARAKTEHYRPLCDKDGYPLVGNVVMKSAKPELRVSELCTLVRERTVLR